MSVRVLLVSILSVTAMSCAGGRSDRDAPAEAGAAPTPSGVAAPASTAAFVEGRDYTVLERARFMDETGFERPAEAFSVLLPRGWSHQGGIVWKGLQDCRGEMVSSKWSVASPDGAIRFQTLPLHAWGWASDPMMLQQMQMQQQQGGCEVGSGIDAARYMREVFAPRELQGATIVDVRQRGRDARTS